LGKCVSQASKPKERKFVWAVTTVLDSQCFCMNNKQREKKEELGAGATMEGEFGACWSIFGVYLEKNTEEPGCQA
jgi:hypothetical protein